MRLGGMDLGLGYRRGGERDPYWSSVGFLAGFDTDLNDEKQGLIGTATGNAARSTASPLVGAASAVFDGNRDYIQYPDNDIFTAVGGALYTAEARMSFASAGVTNAAIMGQWGATAAEASWFLFLNGGQLMLRFYENLGTFHDTAGAWAPAAGTPYHVMWDWDASRVLRIYVNGVMIAKATQNFGMLDGNGLFQIGAIASNAAFDLNGKLDEIRITKGVPRCASDAGFTPPTTAFPRA